MSALIRFTKHVFFFSVLIDVFFIVFSALQTEIENGRLAMMGFVVQIIYEIITGNTVGGEFRRILFGEFEFEMEYVVQ